jgi:hypothetical protein
MLEGIERLKAQANSFPDFQKNLEKGTCVTCGLVPLKDCDSLLGMCDSCKKSIVVTQKQFDDIWFAAQKMKKVNNEL